MPRCGKRWRSLSERVRYSQAAVVAALPIVLSAIDGDCVVQLDDLLVAPVAVK
jgi:hypothetical protein